MHQRPPVCLALCWAMLGAQMLPGNVGPVQASGAPKTEAELCLARLATVPCDIGKCPLLGPVFSL